MNLGCCPYAQQRPQGPDPYLEVDQRWGAGQYGQDQPEIGARMAGSTTKETGEKQQVERCLQLLVVDARETLCQLY